MKDVLNKIWFTVYSRGNRKMGSSAFEHIFLGEIKRNEVSGLHNWIYFSNEEQKGRLNYLGHMQTLDFKGVRYLSSSSICSLLFYKRAQMKVLGYKLAYGQKDKVMKLS